MFQCRPNVYFVCVIQAAHVCFVSLLDYLYLKIIDHCAQVST